MTEDRTHWETLVSKAREEPIPLLDVASPVAERIAGLAPLRVLDWPTYSATGLSVAAALLMMLTAVLSGVSWDDPLGDWFSSLFMVVS